MRLGISCGLLLAFLGTAPAGFSASSAQEVDKSCRSLRSLGRMYLAFGRVTQAQQYTGRALDMALKDNASGEELSLCFSDAAWVAMEREDYCQAEAHWLESLRLQQEYLGSDHPHTAYTFRSLAALYLETGRYPRARQHMQQALEIMTLYHLQDDPALGPFQADLARVMAYQGELEEAGDLYRQAHRSILASYGADHLYTARFLCEYADYTLKAGRLEQARQLLEQSKQISSQRTDYTPSGQRRQQSIEAAVQEALSRLDQTEGTPQDKDVERGHQQAREENRYVNRSQTG